MSTSWGYSAENGPAVWGKLFPLANGNRQSPVNIETKSNIQKTGNFSPLQFKYVPENTRSLVNPGYCWRVDVNGEGSQLTGGPLNSDTFVLEQFHSHWGCSNERGSEHTVDGVSYAGELHLVHWDKSKYSSFAEAAGQPDGLAVLGVFLKVGKHHEEMDKIAQLLPFITHKGDRITLPHAIDPAKLLPKDTNYWTYLGSLTTPPFYESVIWIVFKDPIEVSEEQIALFRQLKCHDVHEESPYDALGGHVINNFRPPLPLGNRTLRESGGH
ncbi:carbonic anhydrase 1 [Culicoides brevitarsis]|uniref:carbonic anhydrase 1 n=1 Tax=Culicoides brevitarsis TaxID=469753 RepID=UPI00307C0ACC